MSSFRRTKRTRLTARPRPLKFDTALASVSILALAVAADAITRAAEAQSTAVPLQWVRIPEGNNTVERLGIMVGLGSGAAKPYLFDTGSTAFNAAYNPNWFPASTTLASNVPYLYGNGTYGFDLDVVGLPSVTFYNSSGSVPIHSVYASEGFRLAKINAWITDVNGTFTADPEWAANVNADRPPFLGAFYGIFGADASTKSLADINVGGIPGQSTKSGYVVAANGSLGNCSPCMILGLSPELRAQFTTLVPWATQGAPFPVSNANGATEFALPFQYALSTPNKAAISWNSPTLLDTGTPNYSLMTSKDVSAFLKNGSDDVIPGVELRYEATTAGAEANGIIASSGEVGPITNTVTIYRPGPDTDNQEYNILGVGFFEKFAVLYDLENRLTGYTANRVTIAPFDKAPTIKAEYGPVGLAGVISGRSPLIVRAGGQATLSANNTYTGATRIAPEGWLGLAGPGSIARSSTVAVNGTLDISRTTNGARVKALSGTGTVALGSQTLGVTNANGDFAGSFTDGGIGRGAGGSLIVWGGHLTLSGNSTHTGGTSIAPGADLSLSGSVQSSIINTGLLNNTGAIGGGVVNRSLVINNGTIQGDVYNAGVISGSGSVGSLTTVQGSVVAPGNSIGMTTVSGNLDVTEGATYAIDVSRSGVSDQIAVGGKANLAGQAAVSLDDGDSAPPALGTTYTVLTANGGISGRFSTLDDSRLLSSEYPFLDSTLDYSRRAVSLSIIRSGTAFASAGLTVNQVAVGTNLDQLPPAANKTDSLVQAVSALGYGTAPAAFTSLSGEVHASATTASYGDARLIQNSILARLRESQAAILPSLAQGSYSAAYSADLPSVPPQPVAVTPTLDTRRFSLWGEGFGSWGRIRSNGNAASLDTSTGGFILGADASLNDKFRLGFAGGFIRTSFDIDGRLSSGSNESIFGAIYGSGSWGSVNLRLGATYAWHDIDTSRTVLFPGFGDVASASYDGSTTQAFGEFGYRFDWSRAWIEPFVGASVLRLHTDGFQEQGGMSALTGYGRDHDLATTTLGVRAEAQIFQDMPLLFKGLVGWRHAYGDVDSEAMLAFAGGASSFLASGVPMDRNALVVEAGLDWRASDAISLGVAYSGQLGQDAREHTLKGNFIWRFETR